MTNKVIISGLAIFILMVSLSFFSANNNSSFVDLEKEEITEEFEDNGAFLNKILPQESPVATAMLFVGSLENKLTDLLAKTPAGSSRSALGGGGPYEDNNISQLETAANSALVAQSPVLSIIPASSNVYFDRLDIVTYEIEEGDSMESIAQDFGVSVETLLGVNSLSQKTKLKPGDKLIILPVDGARHMVKPGETLSSIAKTYKAEEDRIIAFNNLPANALIKAGDVLIIPGAQFHVPISPKHAPAISIPASQLPNLTGYYGLPTAGGKITQGLHPYNAVDVGGRAWCNTPLYASAAGTVIVADDKGWNGGYGKYIKIAHDNGTITLYAHASQLLISQNQFVNKGQIIALMGSTGNSTGCHVHFEVRGARNPLGSY